MVKILSTISKKVKNKLSSIPTRLRAKREYKNDVYEWNRVGSNLVRSKRKTPLKTYNNASTGIRKK